MGGADQRTTRLVARASHVPSVSEFRFDQSTLNWIPVRSPTAAGRPAPLSLCPVQAAAEVAGGMLTQLINELVGEETIAASDCVPCVIDRPPRCTTRLPPSRDR